MLVFPWTARLAASCSGGALLVILLSGCAAGERSSVETAGSPRPLYRPGQSLDARLCECKECFQRACCSGEPNAAEGSDDSGYGIFVAACGRCVRRTWTVRGNDSCASRAPSECCAGTLTDPT